MFYLALVFLHAFILFIHYDQQRNRRAQKKINYPFVICASLLFPIFDITLLVYYMKQYKHN